MESLTARTTFGTWGTLLLPIDDKDRIEWNALGEEIDLLIAAGLSGIYSNGTAGEFHNQREEEFDRVCSILADQCNRASMPFQIGASAPNPTISLERLRRARKFVPGAFQVILPDWFPVNDREMVSFLARMAEEAAPIPLVLYNPPHAKRRLDAAGFDAILDEIPALIGIKVADGDERWYQSMRPVMDKCSVFVPGHHLATGVAAGARGSYSNVACLNPAAAQRWYRKMLDDPGAAAELESRICTFMAESIAPFISEKGYSNGAADKLLAAVGGWGPVGTRLRWPYESIPAEVVPGIRTRGHQIIPEFFE